MDEPRTRAGVRPVGPAAVIDIKGDITAASEPVLMSAYEEAGREGARRLVLNFGGLEYMNSGGIGMLVTLLVRANRHRQELAAFGLSPHYREIFEITRLDEAITIYDSEQSALAGTAGEGVAMTEPPGPEDTAPAERARPGVPPEHRATAGDASVTPACPPPRDAGSWAAKVGRLAVPRRGFRGANVDGRYLTGPIQGFGKMWQKTYRLEVGAGVSPKAAIVTWKKHFAEFWPRGSRFDGPLTGLRPGEVALLDVGIGGGMRLSTGVFVLYADEESFTLMTPQGHMFAGWITFSAERAGGGDRKALADRPTVLQVRVLMRANDPLYELAMSLGGHRKEDRFWVQTMTALARYLGAPAGQVHTSTVCIDPRRQWGRAGGVWHNAMARSALQAVAEPFAALARRRRDDGRSAHPRRS